MTHEGDLVDMRVSAMLQVLGPKVIRARLGYLHVYLQCVIVLEWTFCSSVLLENPWFMGQSVSASLGQ